MLLIPAGGSGGRKNRHSVERQGALFVLHQGQSEKSRRERYKFAVNPPAGDCRQWGHNTAVPSGPSTPSLPSPPNKKRSHGPCANMNIAIICTCGHPRNTERRDTVVHAAGGAEEDESRRYVCGMHCVSHRLPCYVVGSIARQRGAGGTQSAAVQTTKPPKR